MRDKLALAPGDKVYNYNVNRPRALVLIIVSTAMISMLVYKITTHDWHYKPCLWCGYLSPGASILFMPLVLLIFFFYANYTIQSLYRNRKRDCVIMLDEEGLYIINGNDKENYEDFISYSAITRISSLHTSQSGGNAIIGVTLESYSDSKVFITSHFDSMELFDDFIQVLTKATGYELQDIPSWERKTTKAKT